MSALKMSLLLSLIITDSGVPVCLADIHFVGFFINHYL